MRSERPVPSSVSALVRELRLFGARHTLEIGVAECARHVVAPRPNCLGKRGAHAAHWTAHALPCLAERRQPIAAVAYTAACHATKSGRVTSRHVFPQYVRANARGSLMGSGGGLALVRHGCTNTTQVHRRWIHRRAQHKRRHTHALARSLTRTRTHTCTHSRIHNILR